MTLYFYLIKLRIRIKYNKISCNSQLKIKTARLAKSTNITIDKIGFLILYRISRRFNRKLNLSFLFLIKYIRNRGKSLIINEIY